MRADRGERFKHGTNANGSKNEEQNKATEHDKPNEHEPRHPFKPALTFGLARVSSPVAICRACPGADDDERQKDGMAPENEEPK
jgi:hypothetical protein